MRPEVSDARRAADCGDLPTDAPPLNASGADAFEAVWPLRPGLSYTRRSRFRSLPMPARLFAMIAVFAAGAVAAVAAGCSDLPPGVIPSHEEAIRSAAANLPPLEATPVADHRELPAEPAAPIYLTAMLDEDERNGGDADSEIAGKEFEAELDEAWGEVDQLERENDELRSELEQLERRVHELEREHEMQMRESEARVKIAVLETKLEAAAEQNELLMTLMKGLFEKLDD